MRRSFYLINMKRKRTVSKVTRHREAEHLSLPVPPSLPPLSFSLPPPRSLPPTPSIPSLPFSMPRDWKRCFIRSKVRQAEKHRGLADRSVGEISLISTKPEILNQTCDSSTIFSNKQRFANTTILLCVCIHNRRKASMSAVHESAASRPFSTWRHFLRSPQIFS